MSMMMDGQRVAQPAFSPAADRNKQHILAQLQRLLPASGTALEIASGTCQHVAWFAAALPGWTWQPSDVQADGFSTITHHTVAAGLRNVRPPLAVDVLQSSWLTAGAMPLGGERFDAIYCANMLHIAPWRTCAALMQGAALRLTPRGQLVLYGPYFEDRVPPSAGNVAFYQSLRARDPDWGVRRREDVESAARAIGLVLNERVEMPSNNLLLVFGRDTAPAC